VSTLKCKKCGNNRFSVTAHVTETWEVDENGEFCDTIETNDEQVVHRPDLDSGNFLFTCRECGTEAEIVP
jgi:hypothetical protein